MPDRTEKRLVFISHSSRDTWVARQIARAVEETGAETFLDAVRIGVGADFAAEIREALIRADELLILWTPWSLERPFVWVEAGGAWLRQILIAQVLYGVTTADLRSRSGFPSFLLDRQMVEIDAIDSYLQQLRERVLGAGAERGPGNDAT